MNTTTDIPPAGPTHPRLRTITTWVDLHSRALLPTMILGYIVVVSLAAIRKFQMYRMGYDLALIQQVIWNTLHGRFFETYAYDFTNNLLGTDSFFVQLVLLPIYAIFPNPTSLLIGETIIVGTSAIPVYLIARDHLKQRWAALLIAAIYLAYLPVLWGNLYEIRERVMAMAWILWILLCIERRWYWRMWIPLILALSCRLDTTIGVAMLGVYTLLLRLPIRRQRQRLDTDDQDPTTPRPVPWRYTITLFISAITWNIFVTRWLIPHYTTRPGYMFLTIYAGLGDTPTEIIWNVVSHPFHTLGMMLAPGKLWYLLGMFLPLIFLPLLSWRLLLTMLPLYGLNLLSPRRIQWDVYHHYQGQIVPLMLLGTIYGLAILYRRRTLGQDTLVFALAGMLMATLISHAVYGNEFGRSFKRWTANERETAANTLIQQIPPDVPVAATNLVAPHIPVRRQIWLVPGDQFYYAAHPFAEAAYALIDMQPQADGSKTPEILDTEKAIAAGGWCQLDLRANYLLLKRQAGAHGEACTQ